MNKQFTEKEINMTLKSIKKCLISLQVKPQ